MSQILGIGTAVSCVVDTSSRPCAPNPDFRCVFDVAGGGEARPSEYLHCSMGALRAAAPCAIHEVDNTCIEGKLGVNN